MKDICNKCAWFNRSLSLEKGQGYRCLGSEDCPVDREKIRAEYENKTNNEM